MVVLGLPDDMQLMESQTYHNIKYGEIKKQTKKMRPGEYMLDIVGDDLNSNSFSGVV